MVDSKFEKNRVFGASICLILITIAALSLSKADLASSFPIRNSQPLPKAVDAANDAQRPLTDEMPEAFESAKMYLCGIGPKPNNSNSLVVWTDKTQQVLAVSAVHEYADIPNYAMPMVMLKTDFNSLFKPVKAVLTGYKVHQDRAMGLVLQIEQLQLLCISTYED